MKYTFQQPFWSLPLILEIWLSVFCQSHLNKTLSSYNFFIFFDTDVVDICTEHTFIDKH